MTKQEKIDLLRSLGAEVYPVPAVPFDDQMNYNHQVICPSEALNKEKLKLINYN